MLMPERFLRARELGADVKRQARTVFVQQSGPRRFRAGRRIGQVDVGSSDAAEGAGRRRRARAAGVVVAVGRRAVAVRHVGGRQEARRRLIGRPARNEALDATHLAEFHQVEGFVIDRNLSLGRPTPDRPPPRLGPCSLTRL